MFIEHDLQPFQSIRGIYRAPSSIEVIVLTYNSSDWINRCLTSIYSQRIPAETSVVVHDDGSDDGTCESIRRLANKYEIPTMLLARSKNSLRQGADFYWELLSSSKSDFVAILDGDDFWLDSDKLYRQHQVMVSDESVALSFHDYAPFESETDAVSTLFPSRMSLLSLRHFSTLASENPIGSSTVMFRTSFLKSVDMTGRSSLPFQDFALWAQLSRAGKYIYVPSLTTAYRWHPTSLSSNKKFLRLLNEAVKVNLWLLAKVAASRREKVLWRLFGSHAVRLIWLPLARLSRRRATINFSPDFLANPHK